jgi:adenylate cyclase
MAEERVQRRLAAILAADVAGYSRMMGADETGTRARFNDRLELAVRPAISEHNGRLVKTMGDGFLVEFGSVVDAVQCAAEIQSAMATRQSSEPEDQKMLFRMGIHLGDVIVEGEDIHGDGVNIAARLEGLADPGGICVSDMVYAGVLNKLSLRFDDLGEKSLKNIDRPLRCYGVQPDDNGATGVLPTLSDKPAVAVLPFENMSGDPEQDYFADGLTEDIITALSLWRFFPVIARNSTFAYKGTSPDVRKVGVELGAGYVVEGSVRKAGNRVRVTAQLIDAQTGHHVWAERYDRNYEDIFELQDEITLRIAANLEPELERAEKQRIVVKPPRDLSAWEYCLRGEAYIEAFTEPANEDARDMFCRAIELDPQYSRAHSGLAFTYVRDLRIWNPENRKEWERLFAESARRAVELDRSDAKARTLLARAYVRAKEFDAAIAEARRAVECNPYDAYPNGVLGDLLVYTGHFEEGLPIIERARKLNPMDPRAHLIDTHMALANLGLGSYAQAIEHARDAIRRKPDFAEPRMLLASALGYLGRSEEVVDALGTLGQSDLQYFDLQPQYAQVTRDCIQEGLRKAGLLDTAPAEDEPLPLPDKPSIAVLPFENMSADPEQEYFADGITEDLITALSRIRWFFVTARNSVFSYKGTAPDVRRVSRDLGVRYVLEGSVRKSGNRVRITAQLIEGATGNHVWAERYDRELGDVFDLQDEMTEKIVGALEPAISKTEIQKSNAKRPDSLDAWDLCQRGWWHRYRLQQEDLAKARSYFERALDADPGFVSAYAGLSDVLSYEVLFAYTNDPGPQSQRAVSLARRAVELDDEDTVAHVTLGRAYLVSKQFESAIGAFRKALQLNPYFAAAHYALGHAYILTGRLQDGIDAVRKAMVLSPQDIWMGPFYARLAQAFLAMKDYAQARDNAEEAFRCPTPPNWPCKSYLVSALGHLGQMAEAEHALNQLLQMRPDLTISWIRSRTSSFLPMSRDYMEDYLDGLRKAGLPE